MFVQSILVDTKKKNPGLDDDEGVWLVGKVKKAEDHRGISSHNLVSNPNPTIEEWVTMHTHATSRTHNPSGFENDSSLAGKKVIRELELAPVYILLALLTNTSTIDD